MARHCVSMFCIFYGIVSGMCIINSSSLVVGTNSLPMANSRDAKSQFIEWLWVCRTVKGESRVLSIHQPSIPNIKLQNEIHISSGFSEHQRGNHLYSIDNNSLYLLGFSQLSILHILQTCSQLMVYWPTFGVKWGLEDEGKLDPLWTEEFRAQSSLASEKALVGPKDLETDWFPQL